MKYNYRKLTLEQYIEELYKDGLKSSNFLTIKEIEQRVQDIGVFRLKGYVKAFRDGLVNYSIDDIFELYDADRKISLKMFTLSSKVEIKLKACLIEAIYELTDNPFFYLLQENYIEEFNLNKESIYDWEVKPRNRNQKDEIYLHYRDYYLANYSFNSNQEYLYKKNIIKLNQDLDINYPPFHYFVENLTLGALIKMLSKLKVDDKNVLKLVAKKFNIFNEKVFLNYLIRLKELRNRCAHNGRLFNRNYRSIKAIGVYKEIRKSIYHHRLLDVYYSLCFLLDDINEIKNNIDLESKFIKDVLENRNEKTKDFVMNRMRKR